MRKPKFKTVRSGFEARIRLDLQERGINFGYETLKLKYTGKFCPHCKRPVTARTYTPDFILHGRVPVVVEAKGRFTSVNRTKMRLVKLAHPRVDIRILFQRDNLLTKGSTTRYSDWAKANGFPFAVGEVIPPEWIPKGNKTTCKK